MSNCIKINLYKAKVKYMADEKYAEYGNWIVGELQTKIIKGQRRPFIHFYVTVSSQYIPFDHLQQHIDNKEEIYEKSIEIEPATLQEYGHFEKKDDINLPAEVKKAMSVIGNYVTSLRENENISMNEYRKSAKQLDNFFKYYEEYIQCKCERCGTNITQEELHNNGKLCTKCIFNAL